MSGYPPPGPYYPPPPGHYLPPHPAHLPPGSFTYLPAAYPYQPPPPHWPQYAQTQPYFTPTPAQPYDYLQTPAPYLPSPTQPLNPELNFGVNVVEQPVIAEPETEPAVTPTQDVITWVPATPTTAQDLEYKAVVGGREGYDGSPLWVIRAHHKGELIPGKLAIKHRYAFIPSVGKEVPVHHLEVLCAKPGCVRWVPSKNGQVPEKAIEAGNTINAEALYIGRVSHKSSVTPGKIQTGAGCCYISYGGSEIPFRKYEVLCEV